MEKTEVNTKGITRKHIHELIEYIARHVIKKPYQTFCRECDIPYTDQNYSHLIKMAVYFNIHIGFHIEYAGTLDPMVTLNHNSELTFEENEIKKNYDRLKDRRRELKKRDKPASDTYIEY